MRIGVNPEKFKKEKNDLKFHRIIIPVHIPNITEEYYKESIDVLDQCLSSLVNTINPVTTVITVINNNSTKEVGLLLNKYLSAIDKLVKYNENKGKVYAVLNEARGAYENFITITDADVIFYQGWETAVFNIFQEFPRAGTVAPLPVPSLSFYKNSAVFFDDLIKNKIRYGKLVSDLDSDLYLKGIGDRALLNRYNHSISWKEKQYFLQGSSKPVIGCGHFVATYRKEIFKNSDSFPLFKFKLGYEEFFLDSKAEELGLYRLSTNKTYAYHMGNKLDENIALRESNRDKRLDEDLISRIKPAPKSLSPLKVRKLYIKLYKNLKIRLVS